jgi:hypothetical protein
MIIKYFDEFNGEWIDITGTTGTTLQFNDASGWTGVPNQVIRGHISQDSTSAPTIVLFENTTGATLTTSRSTDGQYRIDANLKIWTSSMFITIGNPQTKVGVYSYILAFNTDTRLDLYSFNGATQSDNALGNTSFEIKIY